MNNKIGVALVKEICPLCGSHIDGPIIINKRLTAGEAAKVEELNGKVIGLLEEPCNQCKDYLSKGFMFIGYDESKSDLTNLPGGFYRTGVMSVVKHDAPIVQEFVRENVPSAIEKGFVFFPNELMEEFGLNQKL